MSITLMSFNNNCMFNLFFSDPQIERTAKKEPISVSICNIFNDEFSLYRALLLIYLMKSLRSCRPHHLRETFPSQLW